MKYKIDDTVTLKGKPYKSVIRLFDSISGVLVKHLIPDVYGKYEHYLVNDNLLDVMFFSNDESIKPKIIRSFKL